MGSIAWQYRQMTVYWQVKQSQVFKSLMQNNFAVSVVLGQSYNLSLVCGL